MLIEWTKKNYHHIAYRTKSSLATDNKGLHDVKEIDLIFGLNEVADENWADAKEMNKSVIEMLKKGDLKERGDSDLSKRTEEKALDLVARCFSEPVLKKWKKDERQSVSDAVEKQLADIKDALTGNKKTQQEATA